MNEIKLTPVSNMDEATLKGIRYLVSDIDDTLTLESYFPAHVYVSLERMRELGVKVLLITGRPAGWCDMIARFLPVDAVVGENGSFYFANHQGRIERVWVDDARTRAANLAKITLWAEQIVSEFPGTALAQDNPFRATDVAVDFCEDVPPLSLEVAEAIKQRFEDFGATAKVSSIHVNAWIGQYDKLTMFERMLGEQFGETLDQALPHAVYTGDSPNDAPMFARFPYSVGMNSVTRYDMPPSDLPTYVTKGDGADGFAELAMRILAAKEKPA